MGDHNVIEALRAVQKGLVRHAHPFRWDCAEGARHVDPRSLQRALQQELIGVETNADREPRPVTLTGAGLAKLAHGG
jgi:hypothetical protein